MEENAEFARGSVVYGGSKLSSEDQWKKLSTKLNTLGPPMRTVVEWKKASFFLTIIYSVCLHKCLQTWADLKSRTKKKIAENMKSMNETGGGLYRVNSLSELEQIIDRTLFLTKAAAPAGRVFGYEAETVDEIISMEDCFETLIDSPPRGEKAIAVITPTRQHQQSQPSQHIQPPNQSQMPKHNRSLQQNQVTHSHNQQHPPTQVSSESTPKQLHTQQSHTHQVHTTKFPHTSQLTLAHHQSHTIQSHDSEQTHAHKQSLTTQQTVQTHQHKRQHDTVADELPGSSSAKKRRPVDEQISLIRRQLRAAEEAAHIAREQTDATKILADAAKRMADAAEVQAQAAKRSADAAEAQISILKTIASIATELIHFNKNK